MRGFATAATVFLLAVSPASATASTLTLGQTGLEGSAEADWVTLGYCGTGNGCAVGADPAATLPAVAATARVGDTVNACETYAGYPYCRDPSSPFVVNGYEQADYIGVTGDSATISFDVNAGAGADEIELGAASGSVTAAPGNDTATGGLGMDTIIEWGTAAHGTDVIRGGADTDVFRCRAPAGTSESASLDDQANDCGSDNVQASVEDLRGDASADTLSGNQLANQLDGEAGSDTLTGGAGADSLIGGAGNDRIFARDGEVDSIACGSGIDQVEADPQDRQSLDCEGNEAWRRGVAYTAWGSSSYLSTASDTSLAQARDAGVRWITLLVTEYMAKRSSTSIAPTSSTPTEASLRHAIARAHELGIKVLLKPHIDVGDGTWRGQIAPSSIPTWFASYQAFINKYAALARDTGVEELAMGTELKSMSSYSADWRAVVAGVRARFAGPITYAANWDEAETVTWWDAVDYIGVDGYFPLGTNTSVAAIEAAWTPWVDRMEALSNLFSRPVVFTEVGYQSIPNCTATPWNTPSNTFEQTCQANAYEAALRTWAKEPWFGGMFWWDWYYQPGGAGLPTVDWSPQGKQAQTVMSSWYTGTTTVSAPTAVSKIVLKLAKKGSGRQATAEVYTAGNAPVAGRFSFNGQALNTASVTAGSDGRAKLQSTTVNSVTASDSFRIEISSPTSGVLVCTVTVSQGNATCRL